MARELAIVLELVRHGAALRSGRRGATLLARAAPPVGRPLRRA
jgi:hypothetical protein